MKLKTIVVDRTRSSFLKEGEAFYLKRLRRYARMEWIEVKPARIKKGRSDKEILVTESRNIDQKLTPKDYLVPLHSTGQALNSEEFAEWLDGLSARTGACVTFVIGGPLGLSQDLLDRGQKILSLSHLTLTHEMARLVLLEQLYRAFTILRGEKYHK